MLPAEHHSYSADEAPGSAPLGWRLGMGLCSVLIALTLAGLAVLLAFELKLHRYF
jgi:hypothetical protein